MDRVTLPPSQQEPSQEELTAEDHQEPPVSRCGCCVLAASKGKYVAALAGCGSCVCGVVHSAVRA